jgi:hypothetical protein
MGQGISASMHRRLVECTDLAKIPGSSSLVVTKTQEVVASVVRDLLSA